MRLAGWAEMAGRHGEKPNASPSGVVAIAIVATPQTILRSQRRPEVQAGR